MNSLLFTWNVDSCSFLAEKNNRRCRPLSGKNHLSSILWVPLYERCLAFKMSKTISFPYFFYAPGRVQSVSCQYNLKACSLFQYHTFLAVFFRDCDCDCCPVHVVGQGIKTYIAKRTRNSDNEKLNLNDQQSTAFIVHTSVSSSQLRANIWKKWQH